MDILTTPLADCIFIGDKGYKLKTDFRIWIEFERIMQDKSITPARKAAMIYDLCFEEPPPYGAALEEVLKFYYGEKPRGKGGGKAVVSFEQDGEYIYAAFLSQYGIDLTEAKLHWHKFRALFAGLNEDNLIVKIMQIRGTDLSQIKDKNHKAYYRKMKRLYRLEKGNTDAAQALGTLFEGVDKDEQRGNDKGA